MLRVKDSVEVEDVRGAQVALVKKAIVSPIRDRFTVKIWNGPGLEVKGNILDHEYAIGEGQDKVAEVSKKWFRVRDSYGVQVDPVQDDIVILAGTVCIDQMARDQNRPDNLQGRVGVEHLLRQLNGLSVQAG